ncbi:hypothetical protein SAMN04487981_118133 [Streptomyces sp. cf386]|nr:hypothetical protein SAMN04487981_118133 [Streptomyces sp. cf386]
MAAGYLDDSTAAHNGSELANWSLTHGVRPARDSPAGATPTRERIGFMEPFHPCSTCTGNPVAAVRLEAFPPDGPRTR